MRIEIPVAWGDMDAFGHVNNTVYLRWFESARIAFFEHVAIPHTDVADRQAPILAKTTCEYVRPVTYPDAVSVSAAIARIGTKSFTMTYIVHSSSLDAVAARGDGVVVWFDYAAKQSAPIPEPLRQRLAQYRDGAPGADAT